MIALSGAGAAYMLNKSARISVTRTESAISLIRFLRSEIECFAMPLPRALERCPRDILRGCGYTGEKPPRSLWEIAECQSDSVTKAQLSRFCDEIGKGYRDEQMVLCDYYLAVLEDRRQQLSDQLPARRKMNSALCMSSALGLVILLF